MALFKNISEAEQTVDGVGLVKPGETCEIKDESFNNPNFERVEEKKTRTREERTNE